MQKTTTLSVIIPAYNEEKILNKTLTEIISFLKGKKYSWEILLVDDGSCDKTSYIVKNFKNKRIRLLVLSKNSGKGAALRTGFLKANGKYIIYSDADLSVGINNVDKFIKKLEMGSDVVIGSRRIAGSKIEVHQPLIRETMGRFYTFLTKIITWMNIADFTCGFKGFRHDAAKKIFINSKVDRWAYDSEIMFLAKKFGFNITQEPVSWVNRQDSRVQLSLVVFESLKDLLSIRANDILGRYNK
jgi:dolichyl-phosphate beta-glucosyltransferase